MLEHDSGGTCSASIIPVYNIESYLQRYIDSVSAQTARSCEVVFVDDGSANSSDAICDTVSLRDSMFKVLHKESGGLSDVGNAGIDAALSLSSAALITGTKRR